MDVQLNSRYTLFTQPSTWSIGYRKRSMQYYIISKLANLSRQPPEAQKIPQVDRKIPRVDRKIHQLNRKIHLPLRNNLMLRTVQAEKSHLKLINVIF